MEAGKEAARQAGLNISLTWLLLPTYRHFVYRYLSPVLFREPAVALWQLSRGVKKPIPVSS
jgi:hypothetical protein